MLKKYLNQIDYLGIQPTFLFDGTFRHRSIFGGVLSILVILADFAVGLYFFTIYITNSSFTVYESFSKNTNPSRIWTTDDFAITILDNNLQLIKESERVFTVKANMTTELQTTDITGAISSTIEYHPINMEKCNLTNFKHAELWKNEQYINSSMCFSNNNNIELKSKGNYGSKGYNGIVVYFQLCKNDSNNGVSNCYPLEKSKEILDNVFVYVKFHDHYYTNIEKDKYFIPYIFSELISASASVFKRQFYIFQTVKYFSDVGLIFESNLHSEYHTLFSKYNSIDLRNELHKSNTFFELSLNMDEKEKQIYRKYYKIQDLCADLGSILRLIYYIGIGLNYFHSANSLIIKMINDNANNYFEKNGENLTSNNVDIIDDTTKSVGTFSNNKTKCLNSNFNNNINNNCTERSTPKMQVDQMYSSINQNDSYNFTTNLKVSNLRKGSLFSRFNLITNVNQSNQHEHVMKFNEEKEVQSKDVVNGNSNSNSNNNKDIVNKNTNTIMIPSSKYSNTMIKDIHKQIQYKHWYEYINPFVFFAPYRYTNSRNTRRRIISNLQIILFKQLEISYYIKQTNIIEKFLYLFVGLDNIHNYNKCVNPFRCVNINLHNNIERESCISNNTVNTNNINDKRLSTTTTTAKKHSSIECNLINKIVFENISQQLKST